MRIAVIDLGTNTFNLLIVDQKKSGFKVLFNDKIPVKLGEGGLNESVIKPEPYLRGLQAFCKWHQTCLEYQTDRIFALATSAIRSAINGGHFIKELKARTGIHVKVISGAKEAELIYYGVRAAFQKPLKKSLIMDIGGGSTEFIIVENDSIIWKKSFLLGAARLLDRFKPTDPISLEEYRAIEDFLEAELVPLWKKVRQFKCASLIGSSGSFDTFAELIIQKSNPKNGLGKRKTYTFNLLDYFVLHNELVKSDHSRRILMPGMLAMRADMIVIASLLSNLVLKKTGIKKMQMSTYSLKEGVIFSQIF